MQLVKLGLAGRCWGLDRAATGTRTGLDRSGSAGQRASSSSAVNEPGQRGKSSPRNHRFRSSWHWS